MQSSPGCSRELHGVSLRVRSGYRCELGLLLYESPILISLLGVQKLRYSNRGLRGGGVGLAQWRGAARSITDPNPRKSSRPLGTATSGSAPATGGWRSRAKPRSSNLASLTRRFRPPRASPPDLSFPGAPRALISPRSLTRRRKM